MKKYVKASANRDIYKVIENHVNLGPGWEFLGLNESQDGSFRVLYRNRSFDITVALRFDYDIMSDRLVYYDWALADIDMTNVGLYTGTFFESISDELNTAGRLILSALTDLDIIGEY